MNLNRPNWKVIDCTAAIFLVIMWCFSTSDPISFTVVALLSLVYIFIHLIAYLININ